MLDDERIKLSPFELEGIPMLDIRYWKTTKLGPRPTKRGIDIEQRLIPKLILALQKTRSRLNAEDARREANTEANG